MRTHYCTQMSGLHDWINILSSTTNPNLQMCKNIIRFFYNDKVEQWFPKATIICGKEVRECLSN